MMTVDIWSDIRCPFCYIGKRNFETALEKFPEKEKIEVNWHSFQLDPNLETRPDLSTLDYFVQVKNVTKEQAQEMFSNVKQMAADTGVQIDPNSSVLANSYRAHLLLQLAIQKGKANQLKEKLFQAHFSEAKNIDDEQTLVDIAVAAGLDQQEAENALTSEELGYAVKQDEMQAQQIGVRGVPLFVFNDKYAVSGAQPAETFLEVLQKAWQEKNPE
ncbi:Predicted dithiol-disulfide isomerase, DsbA family [Salinimicrobium catena]|uniref:Predicted dithiol-disulfide isomerase, DsbA family n=1 Tax=Salinimicrobium catena TaxID=390640 RepID=A0A1H5NWB6_9FLAO|nr:DsbA family oxidoreductase [Salinimicrobium catena]SDL58855.1 Predicted dithiol-disulfide isomerase, DsbA family [Salinimicrobium catena]SEF05959.1 Predicted dithiol-disulfide isomerase, DsbA family [Salinimicrobium catena]